MSEMIIIDPIVAFFKEPNIKAEIKGKAIETLVLPEMPSPPELGPAWQYLREQNAKADAKAEENRQKAQERIKAWRDKRATKPAGGNRVMFQKHSETFSTFPKHSERVNDNVNVNVNENVNDNEKIVFVNEYETRAQGARATATTTGDFPASSQRPSPKVCEFEDITPEHFRSPNVALLFLAATVTGDYTARARHAWEKQRKRIGEDLFREILNTFWHELKAGEIPGNPAAAFTARLLDAPPLQK